MPIVPIPFSGALKYSGRAEFSFLQNFHQTSSKIFDNANISPKVMDALQNTPPLSSTHGFLTLADQCYPLWLKNTPYAPPVLFYEGNLKLLNEPIFAIVGARKCTQLAKNITSEYANIISQHAVIVSGLAYGVDQIAHLANPSRSIGICAHGLNCVQSGYRKELQNRILNEGGLLLSEFPNDQPIQKWQFVQRNRIVAGLAQWLLLVEAAKNSGSLITAKYAMDFGREVFVIPNHPSVHNALGGLELIQQGASLVLDIQNIIEYLPQKSHQISKEILQYLEKTRSLLELQQLTKEPLDELLKQLQLLKQQGLVEEYGMFWRRKDS